MRLSEFFCNLRPAYQAELDDLTFDSEGRNVLKQRLQDKRSQVLFLRQMMALSPEMVAVVFHGGFHFELPAVMEQLLTLESDEFPPWHSLADAVQLTPWAQELAASFLQEPQGDWFMTAAAALEYLFQRPAAAHHEASAPGTATPSATGHRHDFDHHKDDDHDHDPGQDEASAQWLEDQGFDRKE